MKSKDWKERLKVSDDDWFGLSLFIDDEGIFDEYETGGVLVSSAEEKLKDFISHEIEEAERRGREEENERCVKLVGEIIQNTAWEAPQQFFDGLRCARESIKLEDLTSKEEKK